METFGWLGGVDWRSKKQREELIERKRQRRRVGQTQGELSILKTIY